MKKLTAFEKNCLWMSIRYAIGRHSIASVTHAQNIAKYAYLKLLKSGDNKEMLAIATDINKSLADILWQWFHFKARNDSQPLNDLFEFMHDYNIKSTDSLATFDVIWFDEDAQKYNYKKSKKLVLHTPVILNMYLDDLIPWQNLAALMDKNCHRIAICKDEEKEKEIEFFYGWHITSRYNSIMEYEKVMIPVNVNKYCYLENHTINPEFVLTTY